MPLSRRDFIASTGAASLSASSPTRPLNILVTGGHPGDPECGCAGTIARYSSLGHKVVLLYMNRGEGFCKGGAPATCGNIRTAEATKACEILHAQPAFAGQIDGQSVVANTEYDSFFRSLDFQKPDIVFAQWPIDHHRDHRALSMLVLDAWLRLDKKPALYYYEVTEDTMMFAPTDFVDISSPAVQSVRHAACYAHASQEPDKWYPRQVELTRFRGIQSGHAQAEAFLRHWESTSAFLP